MLSYLICLLNNCLVDLWTQHNVNTPGCAIKTILTACQCPTKRRLGWAIFRTCQKQLFIKHFLFLIKAKNEKLINTFFSQFKTKTFTTMLVLISHLHIYVETMRHKQNDFLYCWKSNLLKKLKYKIINKTKWKAIFQNANIYDIFLFVG